MRLYLVLLGGGSIFLIGKNALHVTTVKPANSKGNPCVLKEVDSTHRCMPSQVCAHRIQHFDT